MPAPTALLRDPETLAQNVEDQSMDLTEAQTGGVTEGVLLDTAALPDTTEDILVDNAALPDATEGVLLDPEALPDTTNITFEGSASSPQEGMEVDMENLPKFAPNSSSTSRTRVESRKIPVPPHRMTPLKNEWPKIYPPLVTHLNLAVRMNLKSKCVELRSSKATEPGALQKGEDFVKSFCLGFAVDDAIALLRMDELYILSFEIKDVKTLQGDHKSRAVGRLAGKDGRTKFAIENATKTRIVLADEKIHILGSFRNIQPAKTAIVSLILGAPAGKVYGNLRTVAARMKERF